MTNNKYKNIYVSAESLIEHLIERKTLYEQDLHRRNKEYYYYGVKVGLDFAIDYIELLIDRGEIMMPNPLEGRDVNV